MLLLVPLTLVLLCTFLAGLAWYEDRMLSPKALILYCAKCRKALPDHAEELVSTQSARILARLSPASDPRHDAVETVEAGGKSAVGKAAVGKSVVGKAAVANGLGGQAAVATGP